MKVIVFGATGHVGRLVVDELQRRGHQVVAFARGNHPFDVEQGTQVVIGDIYDSHAVQAAVEGCDAVISCLGSWHTQKQNVLSTAMTTLVPFMERQGPKRLITLTGSDARLPKEVQSGLQRLLRPAFKIIAPKILADSEAHLQFLTGSELDWTALRSPVMRNSGSNKAVINFVPPKPWETVSRLSVASAIVDRLEAGDNIGQAPFLHSA